MNGTILFVRHRTNEQSIDRLVRRSEFQGPARLQSAGPRNPRWTFEPLRRIILEVPLIAIFISEMLPGRREWMDGRQLAPHPTMPGLSREPNLLLGTD